MTDILLITGLSGAGRSEAAGVLEDLGWYVVDNLPITLLDKIVELAGGTRSSIPRLALVSGRQHLELLGKFLSLRADGHHVRMLFLEASTPALIRRYNTERRPHPLAEEAGSVAEAVEMERQILEPLRAAADLVIDSSLLNVHQLKATLVGAFSDGATTGMQMVVLSFGFKQGLPLDVDIVMDVRFLPNPHWVEELRPQSGKDAPVRDYVLGDPAAADFVDRFEGLLATLVPQYAAEGKSYLTVAIGCTGGRHRSVAITEELACRLRDRGLPARAAHRDLNHG